MNLSEQNILLLSRSTQHGGTENVIVQLCEILKPVCNKVMVCTADGFKTELLNVLGVKHYVIPDIQDKSPVAMLKIVHTLKYIVKKEKITIIHSHHRMAAFYAELLFGENIIKIANAHNIFTDRVKLTRFAYHNTHMVAVGEKVKDNLVNLYGLPEKQVAVIHNAVKPFHGRMTPVKELKDARKAGYTLIGNVGRLSEQKGMKYFIQAATKVLRTCPKARFFIVGTGELEEELKADVKRLLPSGYITFLGYRSDIQNVMLQLDFIVLSSLWEGFPLTPIEAFSVGKSVVATDVDGTPEIVENGKNGLLVKAKDVNGLADAMVEMIDSKDEREWFGQNAYKRYEEGFSFESMAERYIQYYKQLCSK